MKRRLPSQDELRLWRLAMRDAEPLSGRPRSAAPASVLAPEPAAATQLLGQPGGQPGGQSLGQPVGVNAPANPSSVARRAAPVVRPAPALAPGTPPGLDRRSDDRLRRGRMDIEARLDLHGKTQAEAHGALAAFIMGSWHAERRCVLVITGKGSFGSPAVLRHAVPRWLGDAPLRQLVVALHPAQPRHGGDGAYYVLIRRKRQAR